MRLGDLSEALSSIAVPHASGRVKCKRRSAGVTPFELGTPHSGTNPLDDQVAFQFGDGADDNHDRSSQRSASVDLLAEADELDVQPVEIIQHIEEVPGRACDAIACPDQDNIEL